MAGTWSQWALWHEPVAMFVSNVDTFKLLKAFRVRLLFIAGSR